MLHDAIHHIIKKSSSTNSDELHDIINQMASDPYPLERWDISYYFNEMHDKYIWHLLTAIHNKHLGLLPPFASFIMGDTIEQLFTIPDSKNHIIDALQYASNGDVIQHILSLPIFANDARAQAIYHIHTGQWQVFLEHLEQWNIRDSFFIFMACDYCNHDIEGNEQSLEEALTYHIGYDMAQFWLEKNHVANDYFTPHISPNIVAPATVNWYVGAVRDKNIPDFSLITKDSLQIKQKLWGIDTTVGRDVTIIWSSNLYDSYSYGNIYGNEYLLCDITDKLLPPLDVAMILRALCYSGYDGEIELLYYRFMSYYNIFAHYAAISGKKLVLRGKYACFALLFLPQATIDAHLDEPYNYRYLSDYLLPYDNGILPFLPTQHYKNISDHIYETWQDIWLSR